LNNPDIPQFGTTYGYLSGTSVAAPFVTGIIALEAAANPAASPAQLKQALLQGVTYDPALGSINGLPPKVATSGVANAYNSVRNILNYYVGDNTAHGGSWTNFYGSSGAYVVGESTGFPSFVSVDQTGGSPVILDNTTKNLAGLQFVGDPTQRISAYEAAASTESINLNFNDGSVHQTELYVADLDKKRRVETVQLVDNVSGAVLDSQTVSLFTKGEYLTYDLRGNVSLRIINDSGPSAVYSGLFFDTPPTAPQTYFATDTTTTGANWRNQYGTQGAIIVDNGTQLPAYVSAFSVTGESTTVLKASTHVTNALQKFTDTNSGIESYWSTSTQMDLNLSTSDGLEHIVTLYLADYDRKKRQERIQVIDPGTGAVLTQQDIANFTTGQFISFQITGNVIFRVINTAGPSAVVSGVFFDDPYGSKVHFVGTDTTSQGNWKQNQYGLTNAYVVGDNFPLIDDPTNALITTSGASQAILGGPSSNPAALFGTGVSNSNKRIPAYLYTNTAMELSFNPGDLVTHTVALYFADLQNYHRIETVTIYDPATLEVETSQVLSHFNKGKYLIFDIVGEALITVSNGGYPNAVLNGVFTT
jgi:hypothetical protein